MKNKIITIIFIIYIFSMSLFSIILKDKEISVTERRRLNTFPKITLSNSYIESVEKYLLDHFPKRDTFRSIKLMLNYKVLNNLNNTYIKDNYIFKSNYPTNEKSISSFINKIDNIKLSLSSDNNIYMMVIPDKNYYLNTSDFLHIDYNFIYEKIESLNINTIDLRDVLTLDDYYETDTHFRQEKLDKVILKMSKEMNFKYKKINYQENVFNSFYGVYYKDSYIKRDGEKLIYLTNDTINSAKVNYLENKNLTSVYNIDKLNSLDSYEVYLDGASSFIEIYNEESNTDKELVIFRDSFASSLTPLLIEYYKKITLIDTRYINSSNYLNLIEFNNQDILFMYSTLIINNANSMKD